MNHDTSTQVKVLLHECVDNAIYRISNNLVYRPFHEALLSSDAILYSSLERSFSTSFGQGPIERISDLIVGETTEDHVKQKTTHVNIFKGAQDQINLWLQGYRDRTIQPNWTREREILKSFNKGDTISVRVISDLWFKRDGQEYFLSLKTVKPNLDQTEKAKSDMLHLLAENPNYKPFFCLYYNPYGEDRSSYKWTIPNGIFNMQSDTCVLIGKEYWDFLGGAGTYEQLLEICQEVGNVTRATVEHLAIKRAISDF